MSADGRYVLFTLDAYGDVNLDPNAPAGQSQQTGPLFRKDMITGEIIRVDTLSDGTYVTPMYGVGNAVISSDGAYVAFTHGNAEYAGSTDSWPEIKSILMCIGKPKTGELKVVDTTPEGFPSSSIAGDSLAISADGMKVAFISDANPQPMHIDWVNNFDIESYMAMTWFRALS